MPSAPDLRSFSAAYLEVMDDAMDRLKLVQQLLDAAQASDHLAFEVQRRTVKVASLLLLQVLRSIARACERSFPRGAYVDIETDARSRRTKPLFGPGARTILPVEFNDAGSRFSLKLRPESMLDHDQIEVIHHNLEQALFEVDHEALMVDETDTLLDAQRQLCDRLFGLLAEHVVGFPECNSTGFVRFDEEPETGVLWLTLDSDVASALTEGGDSSFEKVGRPAKWTRMAP